jgi:sulfate adenylyltransferase
VSTPIEVCADRDRKGLYARAMRGEIADFTGISSPYEEPDDADLRIDASVDEPDESLRILLDFLTERGFLPDEA